jgi:hypothetical protein
VILGFAAWHFSLFHGHFECRVKLTARWG